MVISPLKKYCVLFMESPLIIVFIALRIVVCLMTLLYIRVIKKGVENGHKLHAALQYHERGHKKGK